MAKWRRLRTHQQDWVAGKIRIHRPIGTEVGIQTQADPVPHCVCVGVVLRGTFLSSLAYLLLSPSGRQNLTTRKTFKLLPSVPYLSRSQSAYFGSKSYRDGLPKEPGVAESSFAWIVQLR